MTQINQQHSDEFQYAQSVRGIAERVAYQLGDAHPGEEFDGFDEKWVMARIIDTLKWLQGRKPSLFSDTKTVELKAGQSAYPRPEDCDKLFQITEVTDEKGRCFPVCEAEYKDIQSSRRWASLMPTCMSAFPIYTFAFNPSNPEEFLLDPIPQKPLTAQVTCSDVNRYLKDPDKVIDCEAAKYINTIVEYVMYQAMSMDSENVTIAALADRHRTTFFDLAPIRRQSDDRDS